MDKPSENSGTSTAPATVECKCGGEVVPTARGQCPGCGRVLPGNRLALVHGGRAAQPLADPERSHLFVAWESDLGGDLSAGQRAVLRRVAEADAVCRTAYSYLEQSRESLTSRRVQQALQVLASHASTVFRGAQALGLARQARTVSPEDWVRERKEGTS